MRERIAADLIQQKEQTPHTPLPSVRKLARHYGASPQTVRKALCDLGAQGMVYSLPRKGYFWGKPAKVPAQTLPPARDWQRVREELEHDLRSGVYHPFQPLPDVKTLARYYHVSPALARRTLAAFAAEGVLRRESRSFYLPLPRTQSESSFIYLVVRSDAQGRLLLDSERERDFVRDVYAEAQERRLRVAVLGCYEDGLSGAVLLDRRGRAARLENAAGTLLGVLVSTWLVREPRRLLRRLGTLAVPLSVWWEHPVAELPRLAAGARMAFFNLAFGDAPGQMVGEYLRAQGIRRVAYVSPFHGSDWSQGRLRGLKKSLERDHFGTVRACTATTWASPAELYAALGTGTRMRQALAKATRELLVPSYADLPEAIVCVNDLVAGIADDNLQGMEPPRLLGFDNSTTSFCLRFDSFAFDTMGMVRLMVYHLLTPGADLFLGRTVHEMVGRVIPAGEFLVAP
jgi:DNA-binding transcriptional regulator YhcF (GntR family)